IAELGRELEAATRLGRIGFDTVAGYLSGAMQALDTRPELLRRTERVTAASLDEQLRGARPPLVLDVRSPREWEAEPIHGSVNFALSHLVESAAQLEERPAVVYCATGYRSAIAASLLARAGFQRITDLIGGLAAWESSGLPTAA